MGQGSQVLGGQAGVNRETGDGCRELYGTSQPKSASDRHTGPKNCVRVEFVAHARTAPAAPQYYPSPRFRERNMKATQRCGLVAGLLMASVMAGFSAQAGDYPEKVVQIIEDSAAGSTPDVALRFVADELSKLWGPASPRR